MINEVAGVWRADEERVYRELRGLLAGGSPADEAEREKLAVVEEIVGNLEADLAETMDELEALRGEEVFDPDTYNQSFSYAGKRIKVLNQSSRLIVDIADEGYLGEPYGVTLGDLDAAYCVLKTDISHRNDPFLGVGVDAVMRREYFGPSTSPDPETTERHLNEALTEAGYTHAYVYGTVEERLDDVLALARTPLAERPTESDGHTVRMREQRTNNYSFRI